MNIYEKLAVARVKLQACGLKMSGRNNYSKYSYFQLGDFMNSINEINAELKISALVHVGTESATLEIINAEKLEEKILFAMPLPPLRESKEPIQEQGKVITYARRYLYLLAYEIAEPDYTDEGDNGNDRAKQATAPEQKPAKATKQAPAKPEPASESWTTEQSKTIATILNSRHVDGTPIFTQKDKDAYTAMRKNCADFATALKQANETYCQRKASYNAEIPSDIF